MGPIGHILSHDTQVSDYNVYWNIFQISEIILIFNFGKEHQKRASFSPFDVRFDNNLLFTNIARCARKFDEIGRIGQSPKLTNVNIHWIFCFSNILLLTLNICAPEL